MLQMQGLICQTVESLKFSERGCEALARSDRHRALRHRALSYRAQHQFVQRFFAPSSL